MCAIPRSLDKAEVCITRSHHTYQGLAVVGTDALWCMNYGYHSSVYPPLYLTHRLKFTFYFPFFILDWFMWKLTFKMKLSSYVCICMPLLQHCCHILAAHNLTGLNNPQNDLDSASFVNRDSQVEKKLYSEPGQREKQQHTLTCY